MGLDITILTTTLYFLSQTSRIFFIEGEYFLTHHTQLALENLNYRLKSLYSIPSVTDISSLATLQTSNQVDKVTKDWIITVKQLQNARNQLGELIRSEHMLNYCADEMYVCNDLVDDIRLGILGLAILNLSFLLGSFGGLLAPKVIKRWIKDEERNIILRGLNLTDV